MYYIERNRTGRYLLEGSWKIPRRFPEARLRIVANGLRRCGMLNVVFVILCFIFVIVCVKIAISYSIFVILIVMFVIFHVKIDTLYVIFNYVICYNWYIICWFCYTTC